MPRLEPEQSVQRCTMNEHFFALTVQIGQIWKQPPHKAAKMFKSPDEAAASNRSVYFTQQIWSWISAQQCAPQWAVGILAGFTRAL